MDSIETSEHLSDKYDFATAAESLEMELQDEGYHMVRLVRCLPTAQHMSTYFIVRQGEDH